MCVRVCALAVGSTGKIKGLSLVRYSDFRRGGSSVKSCTGHLGASQAFWDLTGSARELALTSVTPH